MAKPCPCGCGIKVKWGKKRIMKQTLGMEAAQPIVERYLTIEEQVPADRRIPMTGADFVQHFKTTAWVMRGYVHETNKDVADMKAIGFPLPPKRDLLPSSAELTQLHRYASRAMACVSIADAGWLVQYMASLSPRNQLLMSTSITSGMH